MLASFTTTRIFKKAVYLQQQQKPTKINKKKKKKKRIRVVRELKIVKKCAIRMCEIEAFFLPRECCNVSYTRLKL